MKAYLSISVIKVGEVELAVIDEGMGSLGGYLVPNENYKEYQQKIQKDFERKGVSNSQNFDFSITLQDNTVLVQEGGIGVTDSKDFEEIYVEIAGLDLSILK
jgi:hypothetical protein